MQNIDYLKENSKNINDEDEDQDLDLNIFYSFLLRNKKIIFLFSLITSLISIGITYIVKPIYRGTFQIVVKKEDNVNTINPLKVFRATQNNNTQEFILNSPSVLMPVFNNIKENYPNQNNKNLSFSGWKKSLKINFEEDSEVLSINYLHQNKEFIISTLNLISQEYQDYSKLNRKQNLEKTLNYLLKQQKLLKKNALNSMKELNEFSIENGLGDIDGFVTLETNNRNEAIIENQLQQNSLSNNKIENQFQIKNKKLKAGQRFSNQFKLLEEYEAQYVDYSSKLTKNSRLLSELKLKIDNLRSSLKRPNEILIKFRELSKKAERDEFILSKIEDELVITKLDIAKQQDPWKLISRPTIDEQRFWPKRKQTAILSFLVGTLFGLIFPYYKEKKGGIIYNDEKIKKILKCNLLETIYLNNIPLSNQLLKTTLETSFIKKVINAKETIYLINFSKNKNYNNELKKSIKVKNLKYIENPNLDLSSYDKIIFLIIEEALTEKEVLLINNYFKIYKNKVLGWVFLDTRTIL